jgi:hypothetical protein
MIRRSRVFWCRISCDARRARLFRYLLMVSPSPSRYSRPSSEMLKSRNFPDLVVISYTSMKFISQIWGEYGASGEPG